MTAKASAAIKRKDGVHSLLVSEFKSLDLMRYKREF